MKIGVDYYPEQWDQSMWERDAEAMATTGVKVVRLAEFAWTKLEPSEGVYDFAWLDEVVRIFSRYGIEIVMSIPTNCPPKWLYEAHPEMIRVGPDGKRLQLGIRGHRCLMSPVFMRYAKKITERMVRHYASITSIVAWQIDNELEAYPCCCDECRNQFRAWLIDKHDNLQNINAFFGTNVWSNEYSDISQIEPPTAYPQMWQNPALCLEYNRFTNDVTANFIHEIAMVIKRELSRAKLTTNTWFCENTPNFYKMYEQLDFVSYDNYPPVRVPEDPDEFYSHAFHLDLMRGIKGRNFWIMEQLSGPTGSWMPMSSTTRPGQLMGYSLQAIAHGADTILHFRWRTAVAGAEMFWHGLIDHSGVPGRRFFEFSELCKTVSKLGVIDTTEIVSDVAIIYSPDNEAAFRIQPQVEGMYYLEQLKYFHAAFSHYGANVDVVPPNADLSGYKVVVAPTMFVYDQTAAENLYRYATAGGTLVLTNRSGVKDQLNNCIADKLPTVFKELVGAEVAEYDPIGSHEQKIRDFAGNIFTCRQWCDILTLTTAKAYAEYDDSFYRSLPAVTLNRYCNGVVYYVGTVCKMDFYESFVGNIMKQTGIPRLKGLPRGVEVTTRTNGLDDFIFFFNNSEKPASINLPKAMFSIIDSIAKDQLDLKPFGFDIVKK